MRIISRVGIGKNPTSHHLDVTGSANFDSQVFFQNNAFFNANVDLGNASSDLIAFNGRCTTSIIPNTNENLNFGSSSLFWQTTYSRNLIIKNAGSIESDGNTINIGTVSSTTINIGRTNTNINIYGTVNKIQSTDTEVFDKLITLNKNGLASSANGSGFEIEENSIITAYFLTSLDRNEWLIKAPNKSGVISLAPGSAAFTHKILSQASANRTWTLPDNTDTFVGTTNAQTIDNKTLNNTITTGTLTINSTNTINGITTINSATTVNNTITSNSSATFSGNVGIGTITPSYKLHTVGTGYFSQDVILAAISGNVGIGTTSPSSKLHLSAGNSSLALFGPNATWAGFLVVGASPNQIAAKKAQVISTDGNLHLDSGTGSSAYINYYSQSNIYINGNPAADLGTYPRNPTGNVGIGRTTFNTDAWGDYYRLEVDKSVGAKSFGCSDWFRSYGTSGWYNQSYGGGIFMQDTTWVRVYNGKSFYVPGEVQCNNVRAFGELLSADPNGGHRWLRCLQTGGTGGNAHIDYSWGNLYFGWFAGNGTYIWAGSNYEKKFQIASGELRIQADSDWIEMVGHYGQTSVQIRSPGESYFSDWPGGWGGGLVTWDICAASIRYSGLSQRSDIRIKKDIVSIENGLDFVLKLNPVSFNFIEKFAQGHPETQYGFIAQEVELLNSNLVTNSQEMDEETDQLVDSYKGMNYIAIIPFLTKAIQEQQQQINDLKNQLKTLSK